MIRPRKVAPPRRFATGVALAPLEPGEIQVGEADKVKRLLAFMAERRVLGADWLPLDRESIIKSAATMRHELRNVSRLLPEESVGFRHVHAMRGICRQFAERVEPKNAKTLIQHQEFYQLVGALRAMLGLQIVLLAEQYGAPIDVRLDSILPPEEEP